MPPEIDPGRLESIVDRFVTWLGYAALAFSLGYGAHILLGCGREGAPIRIDTSKIEPPADAVKVNISEYGWAPPGWFAVWCVDGNAAIMRMGDAQAQHEIAP